MPLKNLFRHVEIGDPSSPSQDVLYTVKNMEHCLNRGIKLDKRGHRDSNACRKLRDELKARESATAVCIYYYYCARCRYIALQHRVHPFMFTISCICSGRRSCDGVVGGGDDDGTMTMMLMLMTGIHERRFHHLQKFHYQLYV